MEKEEFRKRSEKLIQKIYDCFDEEKDVIVTCESLIFIIISIASEQDNEECAIQEFSKNLIKRYKHFKEHHEQD